MKKTIENIGIILGISGGISGLGISLCYAIPSQVYVEGKVVKEGGTLPNLMKSSGALFGNESVKLGGANYVLTVATNQGNYTFEVKQNVWGGVKTLPALTEAIEEGDLVRFMIEGGHSKFGNDHIGQILTSEIDLLEKGRK